MFGKFATKAQSKSEMGKPLKWRLHFYTILWPCLMQEPTFDILDHGSWFVSLKLHVILGFLATCSKQAVNTALTYLHLIKLI